MYASYLVSRVNISLIRKLTVGQRIEADVVAWLVRENEECTGCAGRTIVTTRFLGRVGVFEGNCPTGVDYQKRDRAQHVQ